MDWYTNERRAMVARIQETTDTVGGVIEDLMAGVAVLIFIAIVLTLGV